MTEGAAEPAGVRQRAPLLAATRSWPSVASVVMRCLLGWLISLQGVAHAAGAATLRELASHPTWIKLGHYQPDASVASGWRSTIHSADFFLAPNGRDDPREELEATVRALARTEGSGSDDHPACRFPARRAWLTQQLGDALPGLDGPPRSCPGLDEFTRRHSVKSVSVVFATGFLANPASFYGHTLLKFNFRGDTARSRLMDVSVNYGAIVSGDESIVTYVVKSLVGGYDAGFSHINFYFHNHNYGDIELRDLWEYELRLPQPATDLIVAHAWEVLGKRYTYYFFRENCALRMAELLEVVDGLDVIPKDWPWIIPQALVRQIAAARYRGEPVLGEVTYHPSRQSRFYAKHAALSKAEGEALEVHVQGPPEPGGTALPSLPTQSQQAVLEAALDYYQYVGAPIDRAPAPLREDYARTLSMRYQLPPSQGSAASSVPAAAPPSPHTARGLGWVQLSAAHSPAAGGSLGLRVRPAYYDVLDSEPGQVANSLLAMGDLQLAARKGRIKLHRFDLLGIESVNPGQTPLKSDGGPGYKLHVGVEPASLECESCSALRVQGDYGVGRVVAPGLFVAGYVGGAVQGCRDHDCPNFVRASVDLIYRPHERAGLRLSVERRAYQGGSALEPLLGTAEARWRIQRDVDLRLLVERERTNRVALGIGRYW